LFSTFQRQFGLGVGSLALLISLNFGIQLLVDLAALHLVDRIGYRAAAISAGVFCSAGLCALGTLPFVMDPYAGLVIAVVINAVGGGLLEVLVSPIVEALPLGNKGAAMSLLHSFYCWGFVAVVVLSTAYFSFIGIENWRWLPLLWTAPPLASLILFIRAPLRPLVEDSSGAAPRGRLFTRRIFLVFFLMMICAGAAEQAMCQWASYFAEAGLRVSKTLGDLLGPCAFAALMGLSRVFFGTRTGELKLERILFFASALCLVSYLVTVFSPLPLISLIGCALCGLSVGIMWPGTFSLASRRFPLGGTAMFAILALAGDGGCGLGPGIVGLISQSSGLNRGLLAAAAFPLIMGAMAVALGRRLTR
jgi:fucose permease